MAVRPLYDIDFRTWAEENAKALREGRFADADIANIALEIESMGNEQEHRLESQLCRLILHLLKWQFQPLKRSPSWRRSIAGARIEIERLFKRNPNLNYKADSLIAEAYSGCRETGCYRNGNVSRPVPFILPVYS